MQREGRSYLFTCGWSRYGLQREQHRRLPEVCEVLVAPLSSQLLRFIRVCVSVFTVMSTLFNVSVLVGLLAALLVVLEQILPVNDSQRPLDVTDLPEKLRTWHARGRMVEVAGHNVFARVEGRPHTERCNSWTFHFALVIVHAGQGAETLLLVHGFPTSSYDYHRALEHLTKDFRVVMFDHLGFGFSDKPNKVSGKHPCRTGYNILTPLRTISFCLQTYIYSLADQAEIALGLWRALNITSGHIVAHDMGDSVVTEILSRRDRRVLPDHFNNFFKVSTDSILESLPFMQKIATCRA